MLSKSDKRLLRADIFRHLDGIVIAPTALALHEKGVLDYLLKESETEISQLARTFSANEGYLNVALHLLASQGWLDVDIDNAADKVSYRVNGRTKDAFRLVPFYKDVVNLMKISARYHKRKFEKEPFLVLEKIMTKFRTSYGLDVSDEASAEYQIIKHIEGILIGPTIVALGMGGMFHKYFLESSFDPAEFHEDGESFGRLLDFFVYLGWFDKKNGYYSFTEKGLFFARRAAAYGVTVSYIPTLRRLDELIFSDASALRALSADKEEIHVDREMNVWGSGGAHSTYFKKMDDVLIEIFNRPLHEQPKGILDMGCGNGAFLIHAYEVIESRTLRGDHLEEHPLFLVGADFNKSALKVTRRNIIKSEIWAKLMWGDIGDPVQLAESLDKDYNIQLEDLLNVRTFLDHNRMWKELDSKENLPLSRSKGAFAHKGKRISNNEVEENLRRHLKSWMPYIRKHGLLVIELHTLAPERIAANIGRTPATAYNGTHGYSDQYILELDIFRSIALELNYRLNEKHSFRFPDSELATVSINYFEGA